MTTTRNKIIEELRLFYGPSEEIEHVIDWLLDAWETHDALIKLFGQDYAWKVFTAPDFSIACHEQREIYH